MEMGLQRCTNDKEKFNIAQVKLQEAIVNYTNCNLTYSLMKREYEQIYKAMRELKTQNWQQMKVSKFLNFNIYLDLIKYAQAKFSEIVQGETIKIAQFIGTI